MLGPPRESADTHRDASEQSAHKDARDETGERALPR
jgi:hypothetical protein